MAKTLSSTSPSIPHGFSNTLYYRLFLVLSFHQNFYFTFTFVLKSFNTFSLNKAYGMSL